jgi:hypothetical protein
MKLKHLAALALIVLSGCNGRSNYRPYDGPDAATLRLYNNAAGHLMVRAFKGGESCTGMQLVTPLVGQQQFDMRIPANKPFTFTALLDLHPELRVTESDRMAERSFYNPLVARADRFYTFVPKPNGLYEFVVETRDPDWVGNLFERDSSGRFVVAPYQPRNNAAVPPPLTGGENCR